MKRTSKNQDLTPLRLLQQEVWKKAIGNEFITKGNHYYEKISAAIAQHTGKAISKDTIRNFLEERHTPSSKALNIYSTFVLGDRENPFSFLDFKAYARQQQLAISTEEYKESPLSFKRYWLAGLFLFSLGCTGAYLTGGWWKPPVQFETYTAIKPDLSSKVAILERLPLKQRDFDLFMDGFKFDSTTHVNKAEGRRIIEWFGVENYFFADLAQPVFEGLLPNGCKLSVSLGARDKEDFYGVFCSCKQVDPDYQDVYVRFEKPRKTIPFYERFYHSDLNLLEQNGWFLFDDSIDVALWNNPKYKNSGYLTLETHLGGPWVENINYSPKTINVLTRPVRCGACCEIEVKLVDFNPNQRYQQAGFFIYYNESPFQSLSFTTVGLSPEKNSEKPGAHRIQAVARSSEYHNAGIIPPQRSLLSLLDENGQAISPADSIIFRLIYKKGEYFFMHKKNEDPYVPLYSRRLFSGYSPKHIGLTAFQGRPDIPFPVYPVADVIPAHFEYVRIKDCEYD